MTREPEVVDALAAISEIRIVPVITIDRIEVALDLAAALVDGGLSVLEITLRTPHGIEAIRKVADNMSDVIVGAGSVTGARDVADVVEAGAQFVVSPGVDEGVMAACDRAGVPAIVGIATPTELMQAKKLGANVVKVFPAEVVGGVQMIRSLAAVWPDMGFMPTGGISESNAEDYLALPQVLAIGGSWMAPAPLVNDDNWTAVSDLARQAVDVARRMQ